MYCPHCGAKNVESAKFCYACGTPLAPVAAAPDAPGVSETSQSMNQSTAFERGVPAPSQQPAGNQVFQNVDCSAPYAAPVSAQSLPANSSVGSKIAAIPTKQKAIIGGVAAVVLVAVVAVVVFLNSGPSNGTIEQIVRENVSTKDMSTGSMWSDGSDYSIKSVKVLNKQKGNMQDVSSYQVMGVRITDPYSARVEVVFANDDSEVTKQGNINLVKANGKWDTIYFTGSELDTTGTKVTGGVDEKKVIQNMGTILSTADASGYSMSLSSLYDNGDFKVKKSDLNSDKATDTVKISCKSSSTYSESKGTITAKFVYGGNGWELNSVKASDDIDKVSYQKLVGTWTGKFKSQSSGEECFGGKANPVKVTITKVDDETGEVEGTFNGVAHNHKTPDNAEDSDAGDTVLTDVPFNMVFTFNSSWSYPSDDYECPQDANGKVTFSLSFGDDAVAEIYTSYQPSSIFDWSYYYDTYTLIKDN